MAQNEQYWIERANRRMDGYQISAIKQARIINRSYNQTCSYVQSEIAKILRHIGDEDSLAYEYRMRRLNALLANTRKMMQELYGITLNDTTEFLRNIIPEAYYHTIFDVAQGAGEQPVFSAVNTRLIDKIVNDQWSGKNYSQRIWWNTSKLSEDVQQLLTTAAMSGESIYKTSRRLSERFGESMNNSVRLIRTETTYACNQAEMASYKSLDIDRYKFVATIDTRTSTICQKLDGKVFETKDAQAGKNLPSMHPNCRSTTIPCFEDGMPEIRAARDKDGNRIKVPADMTYPEWYEKYIKPSEGGNGSQKPQKTLDSKPAEINIPAPDNGQPEYTDTPIPKNVHNSSVTDKVTAEERKELLSRDKVDIAENAKTVEKVSAVEETSGFKQAKTIEEAEKFALENGVRHVNYSDLPLETANLLNEAAMTLPEDIRPAYIGSGKSVQKVTGKKFPRKEKNYYGVHMDVLQMHFGEYPNIEYDFEGGDVVGISTAYKTPEKIHKSKVEGNKAYAEKHDGHTQFFNEDGRSTAFHEMGHVYADKKGIPEGFASDAERWLKESKCDMLKSTDEAWAEAWGAYHTKNPNLPDYIAEYVEKATNTPVNKQSIDKSEINDIISLRDDNSLYKPVTQEAIDRVPKLDIFDDDEMNKRHQQAAKDLLTEVKRRNDVPVGTEFSIRYDKDMKPLKDETYRQGEVGTVKLEDPGLLFHAFHNHGSNETFSITDMMKLSDVDNMLSLTVAGNSGNNYIISKDTGFDKFGYKEYLYSKSKEVFFKTDEFEFSFETMSDKSQSEKFKKALSTLNDNQLLVLKSSIVNKCEEIAEGGNIYGVKYKKTRLAE